MKTQFALLILTLIAVSLLIAGCMGETTLPSLEAAPIPTLAPPPVDPTIAAMPRQSISFSVSASIPVGQAPRIGHDLIGRRDCLMCHKQGVNNTPRIPDAHRGLTSSTCQSCHTSQASAELSGEEMYLKVCARCHGQNGEGGEGPALNSNAYLNNTTDEVIRSVIQHGRDASTMIAWEDSGLLTESEIDELVSLIRSWEATAPDQPVSTATPATINSQKDSEEGKLIFSQNCSGCHGMEGETINLANNLALKQSVNQMNDDVISQIIRDGVDEMPSFQSILTTEDINNLLMYMHTVFESSNEEASTPSFSKEILPIFDQKCVFCHGNSGNWQSGSYDEVMQTGANAPVIIPGNAEDSLLIQKLHATQTIGLPMPPGNLLAESEIDLVARWIDAGAPEN